MVVQSVGEYVYDYSVCFALKVRSDIRMPKAGLGMNVTKRSLDSAGDSNSTATKAQLVQKRYQEVIQLEEAKRKRLDND
jgi:hypothetical protein